METTKQPHSKKTRLIIIGAVVLLVVVGLYVFWKVEISPVIKRQDDRTYGLIKRAHLIQILFAMNVYSENYSNYLPDPDNFPEQLEKSGLLESLCDSSEFPRTKGWERKVLEKLLNDNRTSSKGRIFAMNKNLKNIRKFDIRHASRTVAIFECRPGTPLAGDKKDLPEKPRFSEGFLIGLVDGHVEDVKPEDIDKFIWEVSTY